MNNFGIFIFVLLSVFIMMYCINAQEAIPTSGGPGLERKCSFP